MAEDPARLMQCFEKARVADEVVEYVVTLGLQSVADFGNFYMEANYQDKIEVLSGQEPLAGEALKEAMSETKLQWLQAHVATEKARSGDKRKTETEGGSPRKKGRTVQHVGNVEVCEAWADGRGCKAKEKDCPGSRKHCCDIMRADGFEYASTSHCRAQCPHAR